jgi:CRP-like cAMP-binding protein
MGSSIFLPRGADSETAGFLARLYDDEVATVLAYTEARRYAAGELAIRHGDADRGLYIVTAGAFEVLVPAPGGAQRAAVFRPGDVFGDLAFLDGRPRSADVRAVGDAEALVMAPAGFDRLRLAEPRLALVFALDLGRILSVRFRALSDRLAALGQITSE